MVVSTYKTLELCFNPHYHESPPYCYYLRAGIHTYRKAPTIGIWELRKLFVVGGMNDWEPMLPEPLRA